MTALRRILFVCLAAAATLLAVLLCAYFTAPLWIDSGAVKKEIARLVEQATGNPVQVEQLRMRLFPPVGVEIDNPRYASPAFTAEAGKAVVDLAFWPLLSGRVQPRLIAVSNARVIVDIAGPGPKAPAPSISDLERQLREGIARLTAMAPGAGLEIDDATLAIRRAGKPEVMLSRLRARARTFETGIAVTLQCASTLWEHASAELSIARESLDGRGRIDFADLDAAALQAYLGGSEWTLEQGSAIGRIDWRMKGLGWIDAQFVATVPHASLRRAATRQEFKGLAAAGSIEARRDSFALRMDRLYLREPRLMLGGEVTLDAQSAGFRIQGGDIDLTQMLAVARNLAPDAPWVANPPIVLRQGVVETVDLRGRAATLQHLSDPTALQGELSLRDGSFDLVRPAVRFTDVSGSVELSEGTLHARRLAARSQNSVLRNGSVDVDLGDDPRLLQGEALIDLDLGDAAAIARQVLTRKDVRLRLDAVQALEGRALAHVQLTEGRTGPQASIDLSELALLVRHRDVPLPIRLTGGRLRYAAGSVAIDQAAGAFGRSPFAGLDATLQLQAPYRFELQQREGRLVLEELYPLLRNVPAASPALDMIKAPTGSILVRDAQAQGELDALQSARFHGTLVPHAVKALVTPMETDVLLDGGTVEVSDRALTLQDIGVQTLDTALRVSAGFGDYRKGIDAFTAMVDGDMGANTLDRIATAAKLPPALEVRPPLHFAGAKVGWHKDGSASFIGKVRVADRTEFEIDARKGGGLLKVGRVRIRDSASDATLSLDISGDNIGATFKGRVAGETLAHVLLNPPLAFQNLEGDFATDLHFTQPWITRASGRLAGAGLEIPIEDSPPLKIAQFAAKAGGDGIEIERASLSIGENDAEFRGKVNRVDSKLILDADLRADKITLPELLDRAGDAGSDKPFQLSDLPLAGRMGLDIGKIESGKVTIAPLVADARLDGETLDLRIERAALCDITMSGTLRGTLTEMQLDGSLASRQADVEKSIACLTSGRVLLSGRLDLDARLTAHGPLGELARKLDGHFTAKATEGHIERFDTLNRIFAFLNLTEVVRGQNLQLGEKGLPYRTIDAKGTLAGETVYLEELVMDAPTVHIAATGSIDYAAGKLGIDVLVAPLQTVNAVLNKIPLVGRIFGGSVLALPVRVSGTVQNPIVVPLGPGSVARRMTSIIANTLKLPLDAVKTVSPTTSDGNAPQ